MSRLKVILKNMVCHPLIFAVALSGIANEHNLKMAEIGARFLNLQRLSNQTAEDSVTILREKLTRSQRFLLYFLGECWLRAVRELTPWPATR